MYIYNVTKMALNGWLNGNKSPHNFKYLIRKRFCLLILEFSILVMAFLNVRRRKGAGAAPRP
mgnify:CR=1 FL=1